MGLSAGGMAGLGLAGGAVSAFGTLESGEAQSQAMAYQAAVAQNNFHTAMMEASQESQVGQAKMYTAGLQGAAELGSFRARTGASGVFARSGTAQTVGESIQRTTGYNEATAQANAAKAAWGKEIAAVGFQNQAALDTFSSNVASTLAPVAAAGGLLSSAATVGANYMKLQTLTG